MKDTAIYGLSSIVGRFLNWALVPIYTYHFVAAEYGIVTNIYAYVALVLTILTYGMETGFFRFANRDDAEAPSTVYTTTLTSIATTSILFIILGCALSPTIAGWLDCPGHPSYIWMMVIAVGCDAFTSIPFAYLRYRQRPVRFATLKLIGIGLNIGLNLFFILLCPWLQREFSQSVAWFYNPSFSVGYIFLANLISSVITLLLLLPELRAEVYGFSGRLLRRMLSYSFPLLILGIAGIMNQTIDKILLPFLVADHADAMTQLGIYGANYKIAIVMVMFIQAFRFAYEPFIFAQARKSTSAESASADPSGTDSYAQAMKWFVIFSLLIFLGVMFFLPLLRYFISPAYFSGLKVVPIVMLAELCFGIFFNLSLWYKLTDRTIWGTWFSLIGLGVTLLGNILLVPRIGYMGCAWAALACYFTMMAVSYLVGRAKFPISYGVGRLSFYLVVALGLWGFSALVATGSNIIDLPLRTLLLVIYGGIVWLREFHPRHGRIPFIK